MAPGNVPNFVTCSSEHVENYGADPRHLTVNQAGSSFSSEAIPERRERGAANDIGRNQTPRGSLEAVLGESAH
jgi:hypothetical protein